MSGSLTGLDTGYCRGLAKPLRGTLRGFEPHVGGTYLSTRLLHFRRRVSFHAAESHPEYSRCP